MVLTSNGTCVCACACVRACVRECVRACVCVCVCVCVYDSLVRTSDPRDGSLQKENARAILRRQIQGAPGPQTSAWDGAAGGATW